MYRSINLSYSEQRPDRSRYSYDVSASYFTPAAADVELDKAIENFAAMGLNAMANITGQAGSYNTPYGGGRIQDAPYPGAYAGSMAGSCYPNQSLAPPTAPQQMQALDYPRSIISTPSRIDSSSSRVSSRHSRHKSHHHQHYPNLQPIDEFSNPQALVPYKKKESKSHASGWDDVGPEDSISQVSSSRGEERRGRTRRREGSVVSRSTVVPGRSQYGMGGGGGGGGSFVEPAFYYTKEVTPW